MKNHFDLKSVLIVLSVLLLAVACTPGSAVSSTTNPLMVSPPANWGGCRVSTGCPIKDSGGCTFRNPSNRSWENLLWRWRNHGLCS